MKTQELLRKFTLDVQEGMSDDQIGEQAEHLSKKIEALVRKETIEDILNVIQEEGLTGVINNKWCDIISVKEIKEYAQSKGITL